MTGRTGEQQSCFLGTRPALCERMFGFVSSSFSSFFSFSSVLFPSVSFLAFVVFCFGCICIPRVCPRYYFVVSDTVWYTQARKYRSLAYWYYLLASIEKLFVACLTTG